MFTSYLNLINRSDDFQIVIDKQKNVKISFKLYLKKISPNFSFEILKNSFVVEIANKRVNEIYEMICWFFHMSVSFSGVHMKKSNQVNRKAPVGALLRCSLLHIG